MKRLILMGLLTMSVIATGAQQVIIVGGAKKEKNDTTEKEKKIRLYGRVYDSFTKAPLKAHVTLMRRDSSVVDTMTCFIMSWGNANSYYQFRVPRKPEHFIIKAECDGYHTGYADYNMRYIARNLEFEVPRMLLKKKSEEDDIFAEGMLDGVVVTGTKVKIAYRGDTIVYNASAFNLPEGSMLDGLIREMPGAELKDNGDIYVNGKKVDYLTLNGKDFFKGNNKVMLDNLPYYTVQNVEVYDKSSEDSRWKGVEVEKKDYVMDVKLKREYNRGILANIEGGMGTDDRYLGRFFSLYYTDHTRLSAFGNANNVNEHRRPGQNGDWSPSNQPQGLRSTKQAGIVITTEDKDKTVEEEFNAIAEWADADDQRRSATERFFTDGNIFGGSASTSRQKDFRANINNGLSLNAPVKIYMNTQLNYYNGNRHSESNDSTWNAADLSRLTNRSFGLGYSKYRSLSLSNALSWFHKLPWGDFISLHFNTKYSFSKPSDSYSQSLTEYLQTGGEDYRNRYADSRNNSYNYEASASYTFSLLSGWRITPNVSYRQTYASAHNMQYRLDWLTSVDNGKWAIDNYDYTANTTPNSLKANHTHQLSTAYSGHPLGWLPSNDILLSVLDRDNSDRHHHLERIYETRLSISRQLANDKGWLAIGLPIQKVDERMHYVDGHIDTLARRSDTWFQPSLSYNEWGKNYKTVQYNLTVDKPDFASIMPSDDTTNPLAYNINNPRLKNRTTHTLNSIFTFMSDSTARHITLHFNADITQNAFGTRTSYDPATGAYTYMQDNVNGNWNSSTGIGYMCPLGEKRFFRIEIATSLNYTHSVDFDMLAATTRQSGEEQADKAALAKVNTWQPEQRVVLRYQRKKLSLALHGDAAWRHSTGTSDNFQTINAWDYSYGLTANYTIPLLNLDLATDLKMFSRRGYNSELMNTDDLVWNASLSRTFLKGKLTARLMAFDILHELSSTQYSVNAQGRTETWRNCIPRYALLTLAYKFQKMPKKQRPTTGSR